MNGPVKFMSAVAALTLAVASLVAPASARDAYVIDGASLFSSATVSRLNGELGDFQRTTGKEIVVVTEPTLGGKTLNDAVESSFAKQQVNGVLFYFAKAEKKDAVVGDRASKAFFPAGSFTNIHDAMRGYLRSGDPDQAILTGVGLVLDQYRGHERALTTHPVVNRLPAPSSTSSIGGGMSLFWLILILFAGFLIIRSIFRAMAGPRPMPPGYGPGMGGPGMGMGGPGYGGYGYGGGGGGGGFFSGLLGGLGGAFLGNELFGNRGNTIIEQGGNPSGVVGDGSVGGGDSSGWQSDAGQADMGGMGGGGWGDSGGGFDSGGGGGGFDGGGGGDGGGGW